MPRERAATGRAFPAVFGAGEVPGASLTPFKRWTAVLERIVHETPATMRQTPGALRFPWPAASPANGVSSCAASTVARDASASTW